MPLIPPLTALAPSSYDKAMVAKLVIPALLMGLSLDVLKAKNPGAEELVVGIEKVFEQSQQRYSKGKPAKPAPLEGKDRVPALNHLRILVELEDFLRQLRESGEIRTKQVDVDSMSSSDKSRILDMRQDALLERITLLIDPPRRPSHRNQEKLLKAFESKAKKARSNESKARKDLDKLYSRNSIDERERDKLKGQIEAAEKELQDLRLAFFGSTSTIEGFEAPFESTSPGPAEDLLSKVIGARDTVLKDLRLTKEELANRKDGEGKKEAVIAGITVRSENLGVILDHSGSMKPFLQPLRDEISKDFPEARFRECYGCALNWQVTGAKDNRSQVVLFMEDLVIVEKVDAIYWFSDLKDPVTPEGLHRLSQLRSRGKTSLYVLSVGEKPDRDLEEEIDSFSKHKGR